MREEIEKILDNHNDDDWQLTKEHIDALLALFKKKCLEVIGEDEEEIEWPEDEIEKYHYMNILLENQLKKEQRQRLKEMTK